MQSVEGLTSLLRIVEERLFVMKVEIKRMSDRGFLVDVQITMLTLWKSYSYQSAEVEMYIVCTVLVNLGYFLDMLQMRSCPCNPDPTCGNDCGIYSSGLSHTQVQD